MSFTKAGLEYSLKLTKPGSPAQARKSGLSQARPSLSPAWPNPGSGHISGNLGTWKSGNWESRNFKSRNHQNPHPCCPKCGQGLSMDRTNPQFAEMLLIFLGGPMGLFSLVGPPEEIPKGSRLDAAYCCSMGAQHLGKDAFGIRG